MASQRMQKNLSSRARALYAPALAAVERTMSRIHRASMPPEAVVKVIVRALTARRPRTRYIVGRDARLQRLVVALLPDRVTDRIITRAMGLP